MDDFFVKVRMVAGGYQTISRHTGFCCRRVTGSRFIFAHKILRWFSPVLLIGVFHRNAGGIAQSMDAGVPDRNLPVTPWLALDGSWARRAAHCVMCRSHFCAMNLAALMAWCASCAGSSRVQWRKAKR